jgi:arylformamidase
VSEIIDISPRLGAGLPVWPGDEPYRFHWTGKLSEGARCNAGALSLSTHAGAHADAPLHVLADGRDVASVALAPYWGPARVLDVSDSTEIGRERIAALDWAGVERVLFRTVSRGAHLTEDAAAFLVEQRVLLVGIDSLSVDVEDHPDMPVHKIFAQAGVAILECLRLEEATAGDYELAALPLAIEGGDASPVRAALRK